MEEKQKRIEKLTKEAAAPDFWDDNEKAAQLSQELADLEEGVKAFQLLKKELEDIKEFESLGENVEGQVSRTEESIKKLEFQTFLSGKYDKGNAVLTITAGAGGQDAQDWATILQRMYERYCEGKGWKVYIIHQSFGEQSSEGRIGTKQVSLEIHGKYAYGFLRAETGVHRLVRISPFSSKSLRHTSFASVEVIPEIDMKIEKDIEINPEDIKVEFFNASGPGGQNVNKRETAVRIVHEPTGIVVSSQAQRSQQQNREKAMQILGAKLYQIKEREQQKEIKKMKGNQSAIEWGSQIRSYVLHPYKLVKDLRTDVEVSDVEAVLDGDLEEFIEAELHISV